KMPNIGQIIQLSDSFDNNLNNSLDKPFILSQGSNKRKFFKDRNGSANIIAAFSYVSCVDNKPFLIQRGYQFLVLEGSAFSVYGIDYSCFPTNAFFRFYQTFNIFKEQVLQTHFNKSKKD